MDSLFPAESLIDECTNEAASWSRRCGMLGTGAAGLLWSLPGAVLAQPVSAAVEWRKTFPKPKGLPVTLLGGQGARLLLAERGSDVCGECDGHGAVDVTVRVRRPPEKAQWPEVTVGSTAFVTVTKMSYSLPTFASVSFFT